MTKDLRKLAVESVRDRLVFLKYKKKSQSLVNMTSTEENAPENVEEPKVEEKVKKELQTKA